PRRLRCGAGGAGTAVHLRRLPWRLDEPGADRLERRGARTGGDLPALLPAGGRRPAVLGGAARQPPLPRRARRSERGGGRATRGGADSPGREQRDPRPRRPRARTDGAGGTDAMATTALAGRARLRRGRMADRRRRLSENPTAFAGVGERVGFFLRPLTACADAAGARMPIALPAGGGA